MSQIHDLPLRSGGTIRFTQDFHEPDSGLTGGQQCGMPSLWIHDGERWVMTDARGPHEVKRWAAIADTVEELLSVIGVRGGP